MTVFTIDGTEFSNVGVESVIRKFDIEDYPDSTGTAINGNLLREVIGTYFMYTLKLDAKALSPQEYDVLYEVLCSPKDYHTISMPYGQQTITFNAQIYSGSDALKMMRDSHNYWGSLTVDIKSKSPLRYPE